jgi:hypothetical protein
MAPAGSYVAMMTPVVEVLLSTRRRPAGMAPSPKRRFPAAEEDREDPNVVQIDQLVLDQGLEQIGGLSCSGVGQIV